MRAAKALDSDDEEKRDSPHDEVSRRAVAPTSPRVNRIENSAGPSGNRICLLNGAAAAIYYVLRQRLWSTGRLHDKKGITFRSAAAISGC